MCKFADQCSREDDSSVRDNRKYKFQKNCYFEISNSMVEIFFILQSKLNLFLIFKQVLEIKFFFIFQSEKCGLKILKLFLIKIF